MTFIWKVVSNFSNGNMKTHEDTWRTCWSFHQTCPDMWHKLLGYDYKLHSGHVDKQRHLGYKILSGMISKQGLKKEHQPVWSLEWDCVRLTDYQHRNPQGSCPNTPHGKLMETIWQANQGWFRVSREGGKGERWQNVSFNLSWLTAVALLLLPAPLTNFHQVANGGGGATSPRSPPAREQL